MHKKCVSPIYQFSTTRTGNVLSLNEKETLNKAPRELRYIFSSSIEMKLYSSNQIHVSIYSKIDRSFLKFVNFVDIPIFVNFVNIIKFVNFLSIVKFVHKATQPNRYLSSRMTKNIVS